MTGMDTDAGVAASGFRTNLNSLRTAQKPAAGTAAYSRHVNRPLGRVVAAFGHTLGLTPNHATAISATMTVTALALLVTVRPGWQLALAVPLLLAGGYVMDSVDGQLARLRRTSSKSGEWLDHSVDCAKTVCLHLAVLVSWYRFPPVESDLSLLVPIGYQVVDVLTYFGMIVMPLLRPVRTSATSTAARREHPLRRWLLLPSDYGAMLWVFALLAWPVLFLSAYAALFAVNTVLLVLAARKWWQELRVLDGLR